MQALQIYSIVIAFSKHKMFNPYYKSKHKLLEFYAFNISKKHTE